MTNKVIGAVIVAGGGIAGIQAALDLANSGYYVHMVEKTSSIGGVMAQLDKTFPTNDCSMCIMSPKLVEVGRNINIKLHTSSEIEKIEGEKGNYQVTLNTTPRYIDSDKCTACGDCAEACPVERPDEYNMNLVIRKAAFKSYAQAVPNGFAIEKLDRAPCSMACPANLNIQGYVAMVKQGKYREAIEIIMKDLPFPGVLGRICPHSCEQNCRRLEVDSAISIRELKRFAADQVDLNDLSVPDIKRKDKTVAVIGSGPSGLTCAYFLALEGYRVNVYESMPEAGGMMRYGIPEHRLPRRVLNAEIKNFERYGIVIHTNTAIGKDITIKELQDSGAKAVYLAAGAWKSLKLGISGENVSEGVLDVTSFLRKVHLGSLKKIRGKIVVIGGGHSALDGARVALRLGASEAHIVYRRSGNEMPAETEEVQEAENEGVKIHFLAAPVHILAENGKVSGIECIKTKLTQPDSTGRRKPVPIKGSKFIIETDWVIPAIGQEPELDFLGTDTGIKVSKWNLLEVNKETLQTSIPGIFAGGDVVTGPTTVIEAVEAGKRSAKYIARYLRGEKLPEKWIDEFPITKNWTQVPDNEPVKNRLDISTLSFEKRLSGFDEVNLRADEKDAQAEAARCLDCGGCCECYQCVDACKANAVTLETHAWQTEHPVINVGALILAPGFKSYDPKNLENYGYKNLPDVITSLEFERILSASGPFEGHIECLSDKSPPRKIAWLQCVGSRDMHKDSHGYCSGVCCMYAIKQAIIAKEHDADLDCSIFYMDMRTHGKGFESCYNEAKDKHGIRFIRCRVHSVFSQTGEEKGQIIDYFDEQTGKTIREVYDIVVLSVGMEIDNEVKALAKKTGIKLTPGGFCETGSFNPVSTSRDGIYVCGVFQGPKDIPQSVIEAGSAALCAGSALIKARNSLTKALIMPPEIDVSGERPRIGVFICHCGINIGGVVDVPAVRDFAKDLPFVEFSDDNLYSCSQDTQDAIANIIKEQNLNRVVVAACTPRTHDPLFQETLMNAGLNKYLFEMVNIRNHDSWVHKNYPEMATKKAKDLVKMAVAKVALFEPLREAQLEVDQNALVIGGGISGMAAAKSLADQGYKVSMVERNVKLGGNANNLYLTSKGESVQDGLARMVKSVQDHDNITTYLNSELETVDGFVGNFDSVVKTGEKSTTIHHGITIIATGAREHKPDEYLYGKDPRVLTGIELDKRFINNEPSLKEIKTAVFIQCVGSREPDRPYCSRICCTHSIVSALHLKELNPEMKIFVLYRDIRTYGEREELYTKAREKGIIFIRFNMENKPKVTAYDHGLEIEVIDHVLNMPITITADILNLAAAVVPYKDDKLAQFFKIPVNDEGFFAEAHVKLAPSDFAVDGVFLCGLAHYPKPIDEAIAQAQAAASSATRLLAQKTINTIGTVAYVDTSFCSGCGVCVSVCPYNAPFIKTEGVNAEKAEINPVLCKGCGACVASCRSGALHLKGFEESQIMAMIAAA